jgi:hypothetical protein
MELEYEELKPILLLDKEGLKFTKIKENNYKIDFMIENNHIILEKVIDFHLIKLVYDLNKDIYENVQLVQLNEHEVIVTAIMKHLFEDIGLPQKCSHIHMTKKTELNKIIFHSKTIYNNIPENVSKEIQLKNLELSEIDNMETICQILTPHQIHFTFQILLNKNTIIPPFVEKMITTIVTKIFKRVKQFIENVRL